MKLKEKREQWEKGLEVKMVVTLPFDTVLVLLLDYDRWSNAGEGRLDSWSLHRYFRAGQDKWEVSVDLKNKLVGECHSRISELSEDDYPEKE